MEQEEKKVKLKFNILAIISIILFCFALSPITLQNDTFYTIKIGELILENGIDMKDHFSWNEDLPYTYPHWAYDVGMYLIYESGENIGNSLKELDFVKEQRRKQEEYTALQEDANVNEILEAGYEAVQDSEKSDITEVVANIINDANFGMIFIYLSTAIFASILGILIYNIGKKLTKNNIVSFFITMGVMYLLKDFIAARAQLVSFILFALTVLFIENFMENKKKRYLVGLVLISIILANIHVAVWPFFFVLFLPYIAEYIIVYIADFHIFSHISVKIKKFKLNKMKSRNVANEKIEKQEKLVEDKIKYLQRIKDKTQEIRKKPYKIRVTKNKAVLWLILIMIICIFTGLLTPLGDVPYTYLVKTMQGNTTQSISEHLPLTLYNDIPTMVVLTIFVLILMFTDTKIKLSDLFMLAGLVFLSFMSRRQISLLLIIGGFILQKLICELINKYDKINFKKVSEYFSSILGRLLIIAIVCTLSLMVFSNKKGQKFINIASYPTDAATYILENIDIENMRLYNEYNYGSYLLFRGIPVFIDSRADLYTPEFNGTKNEEGKYEGRDIFSDYINISSIGTYHETKFEEYGITHIICVNNAKLNLFLSRDSKYKQLYKDSNFVIYERTK